MRAASLTSTSKRMSVFAILLVVFALANLAFAQTAKHKNPQPALQAQNVSAVKTGPAKRSSAPPPATTNTWTGGGGSTNTNWSDAANWNNGAISSGENILINLATANTVDDQGFTIGTLTLSNAGDSVSLNNNVQTTVTGNISNAGTITFNANGNTTGLFLNNSLTLSGAGTIDLTTSGAAYTGALYGVAGSVLTTSSNIVGAGTVGNGELDFVNSGTINANTSGQTLLLNPYLCTACTNSNTGTLEATSGGVLNMSGGTWTQSGGGKITAANNSNVYLENNVSITGGTLSTSGSGAITNISGSDVFLANVTNSGNYVIQNNGATEVSGTFTNNGTVTINATGNTSEIYLTGNTTLAGSGTINLTSTNGDYTGFIDGVGASVLTNQTTINGWGSVGNGNLQITNTPSGVINSNQSGGNITVQPYGVTTSSNAGLIEATNGGTITMNNGTWTNTGKIEAQAGSAINLINNVSITGGTLESLGSGSSVNDVAGYNIFLTNLTLAGTYNVQNNAATEINGTITNNGVINLNGTGNTTELYVTTANTGSATLTGTGSIVMGTGAGNQINGVGGTSLTIDQNVSGTGNIGEGNLTLTNNSTFNANISPTISTTALTVQPGTGGMINAGTMEATNGGTLQLFGGSITNTGGTIQATGADSKGNASTVILDNSVSITGGTLTTSGAGLFEITSGQQASLTSLTTSGTLNVLNNGELNTNGTIVNNGTISLIGTGNNTFLYAPTSTTLNGTGSVVMTSTNGDYTGIIQTAGGMTLTNNETISGWGTIEDGTFVNNGTINSNQNGGLITLQSFSAATNTKTMEATNGGTLALNGSNWTNTGGTISAATGSSVELYNDVSITGGTLSTSGTGQFYVPNGNQANLTTLTTAGAINVQNNGELNINGTITNNGIITLAGTGNNTYLYAPTSATLAGTGSVVLTGSGANYTGIIDTNGGQTLTNDETISGWGTIENGTFVNNGVVNANQSGGLIVYQGLTGTNTKTMEATNGGNLAFNGTTWTQAATGTIAAQAGSTVELYNNASITGGTLSTAGTGFFYTPNGNISYLANLTNNGTFNIQNNGQTQLTGTLTNNGSFNLQGSGNNTYLEINGAVTLKGTGVIDLGGTCNTCDFIYGQGSTPTLTSFNTIEGAGNLGSGNMGFTNDGTLNANSAGQAIIINVNSSGFTNYDAATTTLTGGTYIANGGNIDFNFGNATGITTLSASVTEEAGGQFANTFNGGSANALASLTSITSTGALTTNVSLTDAGAFSNAGALTILGGTTFKVGSLAQISSGSLTAGSYVLDSNLDITGAAQTITTNAATLTLAGGTIFNTSNSTNALAGLANNTGKLTIGGNKAFTTTASTFSNTGTLTVNAGSTFTAPALTQISGTTLSAGTYVLSGNLDLNSGVSIATNAATLTLSGGTINSGSTNALAGLAANTKSLTLANNANFTTTGNFSNTGSLTVNGGSTFTVTSALAQYKSGTNALQGGVFVVGGTLGFAGGANGIETDAANLTMEGTGTINNTTSGANANALANFNTIASTGSFTLADAANFTAAANFTNSGKLTINAGSTLGVTGTLTNLSSGTLTGGTYTIAGTLQLAGANGGITTNAANLTLSGTSAKILDGTANALSSFDNNTGTLNLATGITLVTANSPFTNSGIVAVAKGTTFEAGTGAAKEYSQTAGTTTVDGTLAGGGTTGISVTGGTLLGAGTVHGNTSNGATVSAGDLGKAGLLAITGTYTQLSSGTLNANIGGTTVGTQYSQLKISGKASLGGTLAVTLINSFTPAVGQTFTVLTAAGGFGGTTFTNTTIAINSSEQFDVSYTSTGVVLTVVAVGPSNSNNHPERSASQAAVAAPKNGVSRNMLVGARNNLRHAIDIGVSKHTGVAVGAVTGRVVLPAVASANSPRVWEHVPSAPSWDHVKALALPATPMTNPGGSRSNLPQHVSVWNGISHAVPVRAPLAGWNGVNNMHRTPMHMLPTTLPVMR